MAYLLHGSIPDKLEALEARLPALSMPALHAVIEYCGRFVADNGIMRLLNELDLISSVDDLKDAWVMVVGSDKMRALEIQGLTPIKDSVTAVTVFTLS